MRKLIGLSKSSSSHSSITNMNTQQEFQQGDLVDAKYRLIYERLWRYSQAILRDAAIPADRKYAQLKWHLSAFWGISSLIPIGPNFPWHDLPTFCSRYNAQKITWLEKGVVASLRCETTHRLPPPHLSLTSSARAAGIGAAGVFDLHLYRDFKHVMDVARTSTEKRGRVNREIARAVRLGYYVHKFAFRQFVPDIVEIHHSKETRDRRPHCSEYWGVFLAREGYQQGNVRTNEQLVGYVSLQRWGNSACTHQLWGMATI